MKMILVFVEILLLSACTPSANKRPATETTFIPDILVTARPSMTFTAEPTQTPLPIASLTPTPAPKPVLILNGVTAGDGADEDYTCLKWRYPNPSFVLYEDGQLFIYSNDKLSQKMLTEQEVQDLLMKIENTGFFGIRDKPGPIENNPLYDLPGPVQYGDGGPAEILTVKSNTIWINNVLAPYVVEPVKDTLSIIYQYRPTDMVPYIPKQLQLIVWRFVESHSYVKTPVPEVSEWPSELPALNEMELPAILDQNSTELLLDLKFFPTLPGVRKVTQDGVEYSVVACPVLP